MTLPSKASGAFSFGDELLQQVNDSREICPRWGTKAGCRKGSRCKLLHVGDKDRLGQIDNFIQASSYDVFARLSCLSASLLLCASLVVIVASLFPINRKHATKVPKGPRVAKKYCQRNMCAPHVDSLFPIDRMTFKGLYLNFI